MSQVAESRHLPIELLSAYIDAQLREQEVERLESHLADCADCRHRLEGLQNVVRGVAHLERMAPPSTLGQQVARRIALERSDPEDLIQRLERRLGGLPPIQGATFLMFSIVVACAIAIVYFSLSTARQETVVVMVDTPAETRFEAVGRTFLWEGTGWRQEGVGQEASQVVTIPSAAWRELLVGHPELAQLPSIEAWRRLLLEVEGQVIELRRADPPPAGQ